MNESPLSPTRSPEEWKELAHRYFDAQTTLEEESALRDFVLTEEATDACFDEVRAVMSYAVVRRSKKSSPPAVAWGRIRNAVAVSACICLGVGIWWQYQPRSKDVCVVYSYGKKITDERQAMEEVNQVLSDIGQGTAAPEVEQQLERLFNHNTSEL